ncbi:hypothetical protein GOV06_02390 [Candidatus Woesearchaeota archaeon]|nr:hypothetical protein [Candidatus Woesearchaeota archaeon]
MDSVTEYIYAVGNPEQLRDGDFNKMPSAGTIKRLDVDLTEESLIVPRFLGVYQKTRIVPDDDVTPSKVYESFEDMFNRILRLGLMLKTGTVDKVDPLLICIGYDGDLWTPELVKMAMKDKIGRLKVASLDDLPNFYDKDTAGIELFLEEHNELTIKGRATEDVLKKLEPQMKYLLKHFPQFGMTRLEYLVLNIVQDKGRTTGLLL